MKGSVPPPHRNTHNLVWMRWKLNWLFLLFRNVCYANPVALYAKAEMQWALRVLAATSMVEHRSALWEQSINPQTVAEMVHSPNLQSTNNYGTCYIWTRDDWVCKGTGQEKGKVRYSLPFGGKTKEGAWNTDCSIHSRDSFACKILLEA